MVKCLYVFTPVVFLTDIPDRDTVALNQKQVSEHPSQQLRTEVQRTPVWKLWE